VRFQSQGGGKSHPRCRIEPLAPSEEPPNHSLPSADTQSHNPSFDDSQAPVDAIEPPLSVLVTVTREGMCRARIRAFDGIDRYRPSFSMITLRRRDGDHFVPLHI
jgi:hypothetical protein